MRNSCGILHLRLRGCPLLEVGTGLLPLQTGKLYFTVLKFYLSFLFGGRGLGICSSSHLAAFWVVSNRSESGMIWGFPKQTGGWNRRTINLDMPPSTVHTLFSSCSLFGDSKRLFHLHRPCLREAQKGNRCTKWWSSSKCKDKCPCSGEGNHTQQYRMTWCQGAAYLKKAKYLLKIVGDFLGYGIAEFGPVNTPIVGFVVLSMSPL